jgi:DinB superfamily
MSELANLLERFRRGAELVAVATTGAAGPVLDFHPAEGKWGVRTIVCHLADSEIVLAMRLRQVIAENNPVMPAFDQDAWAERLDYSKRKLTPALETFRRTRAENYELLKDLP